MDSEFNSYSFDEDTQGGEIVLGESVRFIFSKKRIYGKMHFLKRPSEKYKNDLVTIESLRKEFAIGYSLDHPNIARYFRFENNTLFEEYIDGKSLRELMEEEDPRLKDKYFLQNLALQLLDILRYLKGMGVAHNDIKPENILITRIGNSIKLVDFNCAQTSDNDVLGGFTESYKAPEQCRGTINCSSDLYQVGKVMEELSTLAGFRNKWKRFIEGTTANHPDNRISLELAEKLVPQPYKFKSQSLAVIFLICLGVISIIIFTTQKNETTVITTDNPIKDTVIIENVRQPERENIKEQSGNNVVDIKTAIDKKILDYTDYYYKTNLYPICREVLENSGRRLTEEEEIELNKAIDKAYRSAMEYGEKLSAQYPDEKNYIERECLKSFEMKISAMSLKLY